MFVNLTPLLKDLNMDAVQFVSQLRQEIKERTGCCCSVGLGENIFLARMATKKAKPDGQYLLEEEDVTELLADLKVSNKIQEVRGEFEQECELFCNLFIYWKISVINSLLEIRSVH